MLILGVKDYFAVAYIKREAGMDFLKAHFMDDERGIVWIYKQSKLTDPDAIYAKQSELLYSSKGSKFMAKIIIFASLPLMIVFVGFVVLPFGIYLLYKANKRAALIQSATRMYCEELGINPV